MRRAALALAVAASALFIELPLAVTIVATHNAHAPVTPANLGRPHRAVSFRTNDGLVLRGSYVPSRNGAAVIVAPGRTGTRRHARMLVRHGYGVLIFDRRGEGKSEGDYRHRLGRPNRLARGCCVRRASARCAQRTRRGVLRPLSLRDGLPPHRPRIRLGRARTARVPRSHEQSPSCGSSETAVSAAASAPAATAGRRPRANRSARAYRRRLA
jgi:hypothetical protein